MKKTHHTFKFKVQPLLRKKEFTEDIKIQKYPYIPVRLYYNSERTPIIEGLVDSGSDVLHIPKAIAESIHLPQKKIIESNSTGGKYECYETEVGLILGRGGRESDLGIVKAVFPTEYQDHPLIVGRHPLFEEFQVIFEEFNEKFKLIPKEEVLKKKK